MKSIVRVLAVACLVMSWASLAENVPDLAKTPDVARAGLTTAKICATKWGKDDRQVAPAMRQQVSAG